MSDFPDALQSRSATAIRRPDRHDVTVPNYRRVRIPGGTYFFTVNLQQRDRSLLVEHVGHLRCAFRVARAERPFEIVAAVVLPNHLHCIWRLPDGDADYAIRWRHIKTLFSRSLMIVGSASRRTSRSERGIWQRRFWEHCIRDERDLLAHIEYVHFNPVKHGYVSETREWPYSTIHRYTESVEMNEKRGGLKPALHALCRAGLDPP
ncbi:MAG TPA: transposase [Rhodanobacteraceae bacterium]|nr:transposase [Rhodanobacteraceae bacterium]